MNKCISFLQFLHKGSTLIFFFIFITTTYLTKFSTYLCSKFFVFYGYLLLQLYGLSLNSDDLPAQLIRISEGLLYLVHWNQATRVQSQSQSQSQSYFTTGGLPPISSSWRQTPWDSRPEIFLQLSPCGYSPYVTSSLTRGWFCRLQLLPAFASAVTLGSESRRTHGHILLPQFRDCPNLEGHGPRIYISQKQGGPVIPPGTGFD
jgi:hypothetical protein